MALNNDSTAFGPYEPLCRQKVTNVSTLMLAIIIIINIIIILRL